MAAKRGALIVLEGVDRAGKSTQCRWLKEALTKQGRAAEVLHFPGKGPGPGIHPRLVAHPRCDFTLEWCKQPDIGIPKPDVILFLHLTPAAAMKRGDFGNERYENLAFQELVLEQFGELMKDESLNWKVLDASQSIEDLHQEIISRVQKTIEKAGEEPIGELWK
uniref:thymidylate kinase-like n=1 Tax=Pristiophorus japonicus TaxID=55135 RepID=UPI00398F63E8